MLSSAVVNRTMSSAFSNKRVKGVKQDIACRSSCCPRVFLFVHTAVIDKQLCLQRIRSSFESLLGCGNLHNHNAMHVWLGSSFRGAFTKELQIQVLRHMEVNRIERHLAATYFGKR